MREGKLDAPVPLVSADEFRRIAEGTNEMIEGLREREKLRATFGKHFSPEIAKRILDAGGCLGGEAMEATILFTDLRNYTGLSEGPPPETVVKILNEYFTMVVQCVRRNGGEVDKFIGDAAMAVFGMYGAPGSCDAAVRAAAEMRDAISSDVYERLSPMEKSMLVFHGDVELKGKSGAFPIFGLRDVTRSRPAHRG